MNFDEHDDALFDQYLEDLLVESIRSKQMERVELDLTVSDRCDNCGAQALYRMTLMALDFDKTDATLDLCGHHYNKHAPVMFGKGWVITASAPGVVSADFAALDGVA